MKTTRRTEIVFERDRTIVYAGRHPQRTGWCAACRAEVLVELGRHEQARTHSAAALDTCRDLFVDS